MGRVDAHADLFDAQRGTLMGVAYRMLGQVADAEDVVQEAWLRWSRVDADQVADAKAFLVRVTTRLAIDRLRRLKARREDYVGEWLPEPIPTAGVIGDNPADAVVLAETLSMAMLVVLEALSPLERAVFILREAFGYSHAEIAESVGRSEVAVRQLARRAREHVDARRPRFDADVALRRDVAERFMVASRRGDLAALMQLLAPDVEFIADGGGVVRAPLLPVRGADRVTRFLLAAGGRVTPDQRMAIVELNAEPAIVSWIGSQIVAVVSLEIVDARIQRILLVGSPEKLRRLGQPA